MSETSLLLAQLKSKPSISGLPSFMVLSVLKIQGTTCCDYDYDYDYLLFIMLNVERERERERDRE